MKRRPITPLVKQKAGVPQGGTTGQALTKVTDKNYDTGWSTVAGGGGAVSSVFGRTGAVVAQTGDYTAAQVGAVPTTRSLTIGPTAQDLSADRTWLADVTDDAQTKAAIVPNTAPTTG